MRKIFKYPLLVGRYQTIQMPRGAKVLTAQMQGSVPVIWALVDPEAEQVGRMVRIYMTGEPMDDLAEFPHYVATLQVIAPMDPTVVLHLFIDQEASV